ncbi:hypothetical protein RSK20926_07382 [Roseobacter sp. SK209-2-6]|nr:hypothetical protein RSK20926_07382 [Roseobacter sp. SK209-2-6]
MGVSRPDNQIDLLGTPDQSTTPQTSQSAGLVSFLLQTSFGVACDLAAAP